MKKKSFQIESLFYLFLMLSPILDSASFLLHTYVPDLPISITAVVRPIIPGILFLTLFFKNKEKRKTMILGGCLYLFYAVGHLWCYQKNLTGSAYGTTLAEAQYLLNYTYMICLFYTVFHLIKQDKLPKLSKYTTFFLAGYVLLLYVALLTGTSSSTYLDGTGYKGWHSSGNAICSVLLLSTCLVLPTITKEKKWGQYGLLLLTGIYLCLLLGTRSGLLGFPLVLIAFLFCYLLFDRESKLHLFLKKHKGKVGISFACLLVLFLLFVGNSETIKRRKSLSNQGDAVIDEVTRKKAHITGTATKHVKAILDETIPKNYMDEPQKKALLALYRKGNDWNLEVEDRRVQQLIYHTYLVKEQKDPLRILFGNGYLANYDEMTLEMEIPAFLYNFGILGFVLYLGPFLWMEGRAMKIFFRKRKEVDTTFVFYLFATLFSLFLSIFAGYTFFHVSSMLVIILLHCLLDKKREEYA